MGRPQRSGQGPSRCNHHPLFPSIFPRAPVHYTRRPRGGVTVEFTGPKRRPSPAGLGAVARTAALGEVSPAAKW